MLVHNKETRPIMSEQLPNFSLPQKISRRLLFPSLNQQMLNLLLHYCVPLTEAGQPAKVGAQGKETHCLTVI